MTSFFTSSSPLKNRRKKRPLLAQRIKLDRIQRHFGENIETYKTFLTRLSYLMESFKFIPLFEGKGYVDAKYGDSVYEFGDATIDPFTVFSPDVPKNEKGVNSPWYAPKGKGMDPSSFGGRHRQIWSGSYWGTTGLSLMKKSVASSFAADDFNPFENVSDIGANQFDALLGKDEFYYSDYTDYSSLWNSEGNIYIDGKPVLPKGVKQLMGQNFGQKSFYQIAMSGVNSGATLFTSGTNTFNDAGDVEDMMYWDQAGYREKLPANLYPEDLSTLSLTSLPFWGKFDYDVSGNPGMFARVALFLNMRESTLRFLAGATEVLGNANLLYKTTNTGGGSQEMIETLEEAMKGLHPANQALLGFWVKPMHSIRSSLAGLVSDPSKIRSVLEYENNLGMVYSGRDGLCLDRFRYAVYRTVKYDYPAYLASIGASNSFIQSWNNIVEEAYNPLQPGLGTHYNAELYFPFWDFFGADAKGDNEKDVTIAESYQLLPDKVWYMDEEGQVHAKHNSEVSHWNYGVDIMKKLTPSQIAGKGNSVYSGYFDKNWMIHAVGSAYNAYGGAVGYNVCVSMLNRTLRAQAKRENEKIDQEEEDMKEQERQVKKMENKRRAERKRFQKKILAGARKQKKRLNKMIRKAVAQAKKAKKQQLAALARAIKQRKERNKRAKSA